MFLGAVAACSDQACIRGHPQNSVAPTSGSESVKAKSSRIVSLPGVQRSAFGQAAGAGDLIDRATALPHQISRKRKDSKSTPPFLETTPAAARFTPYRTAESPRLAGAILQSGVLAYRPTEDGEPLVLMVSKKKSRQWGIPKGRAVPHLSLSENAAKEAFEEAGVRGTISQHAVGMFRSKKRTPDHFTCRVIEVWVYLLEVSEALTKWPEKGQRQVQWVPCRTAAILLREPVLAELCRKLTRGRKEAEPTP